MKIIAVALFLSVLVGCSNVAAVQYYKAVQTASVSHSETQMARFQALRDMSKGDSHASVAAVMALAMLKTETIRPAYIESEALSYTKALAGPLTAVAALVIQADLSAQNNKENNKTARAQIGANAVEQQALFDAFGDSSSSGGVTTDAAIVGLVDIAGQAITGSTTTSGKAVDASTITSGASIDGVVDISTIGFGTIEDVVVDGNSTLVDILEIPEPIIPVVPPVTVVNP